jgi:hypothetical protein
LRDTPVQRHPRAHAAAAPPPWRQLAHTAAAQSITRETAARLRRAQLVVWVLARGGRMAPTVE